MSSNPEDLSYYEQALPAIGKRIFFSPELVVDVVADVVNRNNVWLVGSLLILLRMHKTDLNPLESKLLQHLKSFAKLKGLSLGPQPSSSQNPSELQQVATTWMPVLLEDQTAVQIWERTVQQQSEPSLLLALNVFLRNYPSLHESIVPSGVAELLRALDRENLTEDDLARCLLLFSVSSGVLSSIVQMEALEGEKMALNHLIPAWLYHMRDRYRGSQNAVNKGEKSQLSPEEQMMLALDIVDTLFSKIHLLRLKYFYAGDASFNKYLSDSERYCHEQGKWLISLLMSAEPLPSLEEEINILSQYRDSLMKLLN